MNNYKRIGDYIKSVKVFNSDLRAKELLGINIDKFFMPSVANVVGTDLSRYKIVEKNQFACNRMHVGRDYRIPVALSDRDEPFMVSPAYDVFEIKDTSILHPEYLMMWFSRAEFDRNAWFYTDADVRGGLAWKAFCDMQLPVPDINKQREIVREYNTIVNRIKLNEQLNQKLEETAQAIYKQWFVDFEFPDENGKPYKSNGGEMVWNDELEKEVPVGWEVKPFTKVCSLKGGGTPSTLNDDYWNGDIFFFTPKDINGSYYSIKTEKTISGEGLKNCSSKLYPKNTVYITARGTVGEICLAGKEMAMNQSCYAIFDENSKNQYFAHQLTLETIKSLKEQAIGAVFKALVTKDFDGQLVIQPKEYISDNYNNIVEPIYEQILNNVLQINYLEEFKNLLLSKMTKVETEKEGI